MEIGYNTLLVLISVMALSLASGQVGTHLMLHKKTLVSDSVAHATLPGLALGYFLSLYLELDDGRNLILLLSVGAMTGYLAQKVITLILNHSALSEDSAIAISLSVFFALGILLFGIIQTMDNAGNRSGLDSFLLGQTSGMTYEDAILITLGSLIIFSLGFFLHKRLVFSGFDPMQSAHLDPYSALGRRCLSALMLGVVCVGLKTTGAILILALLIIPPATARLWSGRNRMIALLSLGLSMAGSITGVLISARYDGFPTGATITLTLFAIFTVSLLYTLLKQYAISNPALRLFYGQRSNQY